MAQAAGTTATGGVATGGSSTGGPGAAGGTSGRVAMPTAAQVLQAETAVMYLLDPAVSGGDALQAAQVPVAVMPPSTVVAVMKALTALRQADKYNKDRLENKSKTT